MPALPDCITIAGGDIGIPRWYAMCSEHPRWRPGSHYGGPELARSDAEQHVRDAHDGIDRTDMPQALVKALARVDDPDLRRRLALAARSWRDA